MDASSNIVLFAPRRYGKTSLVMRVLNDLSVKEGIRGMDAPVTRLFITGVTPVTMDDVTSGFNIATNISMNPAFAALAKIREAASAQIDRYAADRDLARKWNLQIQGGTVKLHRIVLVFHGGDVALCEEVA